MSLAPAVLDALLAAGCSAEQIVAAVKADQAEAEERREAKRANNAERQRRFRDKRKSRKDNARNALPDVTPPIEELHTPSDFSPSGENHIPNTKPKRRKSRKPAEDGDPLPADWTPTPGPKTQVMVDGWPPGKFDRELRKFTAHAADKGRLSKDWDAAFRTWLENADEWMTKNERSASSSDQHTNAYVRAGLDGIARRQAERAGAEFG